MLHLSETIQLSTIQYKYFYNRSSNHRVNDRNRHSPGTYNIEYFMFVGQLQKKHILQSLTHVLHLLEQIQLSTIQYQFFYNPSHKCSPHDSGKAEMSESNT